MAQLLTEDPLERKFSSSQIVEVPFLGQRPEGGLCGKEVDPVRAYVNPALGKLKEDCKFKATLGNAVWFVSKD